jgi:hypothetical protein
MKVYHGSYIKVDKIDLSKCKPNKDFGKGFYVTKFRNHAKEWAKIIGKKYETDGSVSNIEWITTHVEKDSDKPDVIASQKACEKAAYDIIAATSKQWKPAKEGNVPVKAEMSLPIWFKFH